MHQAIAKHLWMVLLIAVLPSAASAALLSNIEQSKKIGDKALITVSFKNTYKEAVKSARATVFLMADGGKVAGFKTAWVIGGGKRKPLEPGETAKYNFVITTKKEFNKPVLALNRTILASGKLIAGKSKIPAAR